METPIPNGPPVHFKIGDLDCSVSITSGPATETTPAGHFIRTRLQGGDVSAVSMARSLMLHALALLDEVERPTDAELVAVAAGAFLPLLGRISALAERVDRRGPDEMAVQGPVK